MADGCAETNRQDEEIMADCIRNNEMAAVIVSAKKFEVMKQTEEAIEFLEIAETVNQRLMSDTLTKKIPWEKIKKKHGL